MTNINTYPIAITGGIASGKSTATKILDGKQNISVVCADKINKEIIQKPSIILKIAKKFGNEIIINNQIDRMMLKNIIIKSKESRKWIEHHLVPIINKSIKMQVEKSTTKITIVDIPLLGPNNIHNYDYLQKIIVIKANFETKIKRLMKRNNQNRQEAIDFINLQISDQEREKIADWTIDNSNLSHQELESKILKAINNITTFTNHN